MPCRIPGRAPVPPEQSFFASSPCPNRSLRGWFRQNGAEDIKKHKWYRGLNWAALYNKTMEAFLVPSVTSENDTSQCAAVFTMNAVVYAVVCCIYYSENDMSQCAAPGLAHVLVCTRTHGAPSVLPAGRFARSRRSRA